MLEVILVKYFVSTCTCHSTTRFILWIVLTITGKYIQWYTTELFIEIYNFSLADFLLAGKPCHRGSYLS